MKKKKGYKKIFVTGGARSGKSDFALKKAEAIKGSRAFIATAEAHDKEMKERIEIHRKERRNKWITYEEPIHLPGLLKKIANNYNVIIVDCLTLWLSNIMATSEKPLKNIENLVRNFRELQWNDASEITKIFTVTNEVGMGIVPANEMARRFRDMSGLMNRMVAELSDEVYMVTSGIPILIKNSRYSS